MIQRELFPDGSETVTESVTVTQQTVRRTYPQKWASYNRAQVQEKEQFQQLLCALCAGIEEPPRATTGRPRIPMNDATFAAVFKVYSTLSGRRFSSDLRDAQEKGYIENAPHYNSVFRCLENENLTPILQQLITRSSLPLRALETEFAVDSTGFTSSRFHRWFDVKYGQPRQEHDWVKAHIACGVRTNIVTAVEIHERNSNDIPLLPALVDATAVNFDVLEVSADKQYASENNFQAIARIGATAYIPFRSGTTGRIGGLFAKAFHYFNLYREDFLAHYHRRSNIESTIMMIKTKFGDHVRSKTDVAMKNEVLAKILAHNICCLISAMHELGISPEFGTCPKTIALASQLA
ncbi:MAG: transposase [Planctomycetaceae bacterium]